MLMKSTAQRCGRLAWILTAFTPALGVRLAAFNPWAYMQIAEQWQKAWTDAMVFWANAGKPNAWPTQL
jgi:hypothetical protein